MADTAAIRIHKQLSDENDSFRTFLIVSLVLHLTFTMGVAIKNWLLPGHTIVVPEAIRVDVVDLPDKLPPAAVHQSAPVPVFKPAPPKAKALNKQNLKAQEKQALQELKAMNDIQKLQEQVNDQNSKAATPKKLTYKGNIISSGNSFSGLSKLRVNEYLQDLTKKIHDHWSLPQWLSDANLKAQVIVSVDASGNVTRSQIYVSSGNSVFDSSCLAAVQQSSPFAPPPDEVQESLLLVRFPFE